MQGHLSQKSEDVLPVAASTQGCLKVAWGGAEASEEGGGMAGVVLASGGDVVAAPAMEEREGEVAEGGEGLGACPVRVVAASSAKTTSRTRWRRFSHPPHSPGATPTTDADTRAPRADPAPAPALTPASGPARPWGPPELGCCLTPDSARTPPFC